MLESSQFSLCQEIFKKFIYLIIFSSFITSPSSFTSPLVLRKSSGVAPNYFLIVELSQTYGVKDTSLFQNYINLVSF